MLQNAQATRNPAAAEIADRTAHVAINDDLDDVRRAT